MYLAYVLYVMFSDRCFLFLCCAFVGPFICGGHFVPACFGDFGSSVSPFLSRQGAYSPHRSEAAVVGGGISDFQCHMVLLPPLLIQLMAGSGRCNSLSFCVLVILLVRLLKVVSGFQEFILYVLN